MTLKSWFWIAIACLVAIGVYFLVAIVDPIDLLIFGGAAALLSTYMIPRLYFHAKCPKCGKRWGLEDGYMTMGKGSFSDWWVPQKCKSCGYERRKRIPWYRRNSD